jgi:hypothetical protein
MGKSKVEFERIRNEMEINGYDENHETVTIGYIYK